MHTEIKGYASGLAWGNTKSVLVETRPWALPTLGRVFSCSSWSFSLQDMSTNHHLLAWLQPCPSVPCIAHLAYLGDMQRCKCMNIRKTTHDAWVLMMQHKAIKERHDQQQLLSKQGNKINVKKKVWRRTRRNSDLTYFSQKVSTQRALLTLFRKAKQKKT